MQEKYHILSMPAGGHHIFIGTLDEALSDCQSRNEWCAPNRVVGSFSNREEAEDLLFEKLGW